MKHGLRSRRMSGKFVESSGGNISAVDPSSGSDAAEKLSSLLNNVPRAVYRGLRDWSLQFLRAEVERLTGAPNAECVRDDEKESAGEVPEPATGRVRAVAGGPPPDDLRRGWPFLPRRRPAAGHHRGEGDRGQSPPDGLPAQRHA